MMLTKIHKNETLGVEIGIHEEKDGFALECRTHGMMRLWGLIEGHALAIADKSEEWCSGCESMKPLIERIKELEETLETIQKFIRAGWMGGDYAKVVSFVGIAGVIDEIPDHIRESLAE